LVGVYKKIPEPITDISQIWPVWKQVSLALGTLTLPERTGEQSASTISPITALSHSLNHSFALFEKWTKAEPLDTWSESRLEAIVVDTKQIHDLHEQALSLLLKQRAASNTKLV